MDLSKIKNLIKQNGDRIIIMENGEPELVVMSFGEYERISESREQSSRHKIKPEADETIPAAAAESIGLPGRLPAGQAGQAGLPVRMEDIRLEDLPV